MTEGISIAVLDNDSWSLRAIARWIDGSSPLYHVIWQTTSAAEAIHRCIYTNDKPNVLLLDMALNDATGISVCTQIRKQTADIGIIGITAYDPERYKTDLALAGGQALIAKEDLAHVCNKVLPWHKANPLNQIRSQPRNKRMTYWRNNPPHPLRSSSSVHESSKCFVFTHKITTLQKSLRNLAFLPILYSLTFTESRKK